MKRIVALITLLVLLVPFAVSCGNNAPKQIVLFPYEARSIDAAEGATFTSSDESVVKVDDSGLAVGMKPGDATITVTEGKKQRVHPVTVLDPAKYISLFDCRNITLKNSEILEKVEQVKKNLLQENATWIAVKDAAQNEDRVTMNYVGKIDGKAFEGGTANGALLILGSDSYIDGFEEGLVGMTTGKEIILNLTFPKDYSSPELAGKPATFHVTLTKIERPEYPEFDNEFVSTHTAYQTVNEFDREEYKNAKITLAIAEMVEKSDILIDPPKALYDHYFDQYILRLQTILY